MLPLEQCLHLQFLQCCSLGFQVVIKEAKQEDKTAQFVLVFEEVEEMKSGKLTLVVLELEAHAIVNLVILESDVVFVDVVRLLDPNLVGPRTSLSRHKLLQVTYGVILVALHTNFLPQPIVQHHFYHLHTSQINNPFFSHSQILGRTIDESC